MSDQFACKFCGAEDEIYELVEIRATGSRSITIGFDASGKFTYEPDGSVDSDYGAQDIDHEGFACARCDKSVAQLEDIAMPIGGPMAVEVGATVAIRDAFGTYERRVIEVVGHGSTKGVVLEHEGARAFRFNEIELRAAA